MNPWVRCWCPWCWAVFPFNYWAVLPPSTAKDAPVMKGALSVRAEVDDRAHCFVTGNEGILGHAPFVIEHGKVRVAYPAVSNLNSTSSGPISPGSKLKGSNGSRGVEAA